MMINTVYKEFRKKFGRGGDIRGFFAPGQVSLIGEHSDSSGGMVLNCALKEGCYAVARKREDKLLNCFFSSFPEDGIFEADLSALSPGGDGTWHDDIAGMLWAFSENELPLPCGFDMIIISTLPADGGMGLSECLKALTAIVCKDLFAMMIPLKKCAAIGQFCDTQYSGVNRGIAGIYTSLLSKKDNLMLVDTFDSSHKYALMNSRDIRLVVFDSGSVSDAGREDAGKEAELGRIALESLQRVEDIESIGELSMEQFDDISDTIEDPKAREWARYIIEERRRSLDAFRSAESSDFKNLGALMNDSDKSFRDVTGELPDKLCKLKDTVWKQNGVLGCLISGSGCVLGLMEADKAEQITESVLSAFQGEDGYAVSACTVVVSDGARRIAIPELAKPPKNAVES